MPIVAVVHPNPQFRQTLKRGIGTPHLRVITCRTVGRVETLIRSELVDAVVNAYFDCARSAGDHADALAGYASKFRFIQPDDVRTAIQREARHWQLHAGIDWDLLERIEDEVIEQGLVPESYQIADYVVRRA